MTGNRGYVTNAFIFSSEWELEVKGQGILRFV